MLKPKITDAQRKSWRKFSNGTLTPSSSFIHSFNHGGVTYYVLNTSLDARSKNMKTTELHTLNECIVLYVNDISIKLLLKQNKCDISPVLGI